MRLWIRLASLFVVLCIIASDRNAAAQTPMQHGVPWRDPSPTNSTVFAAPPGAHLSYFGGPVISNVHVVQVLYGSGSYNAQVAGTATPSMGTFYNDITAASSLC